jgi:hypothetical protein
MAFMLVSNWMGSPEYRVQSSPDLEVSQEIMPQEGPSVLLGVPYEDLVPGTYLPGQEVSGNPHLTKALEEFAAAMERRSCTLTGDPKYDECEVTGEDRWGNYFTTNAMPDPTASLRIRQLQPNLKELMLMFESVNPSNPDELLIDSAPVSYRHSDSNYEEECRFVNKNC